MFSVEVKGLNNVHVFLQWIVLIVIIQDIGRTDIFLVDVLLR